MNNKYFELRNKEALQAQRTIITGLTYGFKSIFFKDEYRKYKDILNQNKVYGFIFEINLVE